MHAGISSADNVSLQTMSNAKSRIHIVRLFFLLSFSNEKNWNKMDELAIRIDITEKQNFKKVTRKQWNSIHAEIGMSWLFSTAHRFFQKGYCCTSWSLIQYCIMIAYFIPHEFLRLNRNRFLTFQRTVKGFVTTYYKYGLDTEAEFKENMTHGTICRSWLYFTLCRLQHAHVPWSTLCQSRLYHPVRDSGIVLW